MIKKRFISMLVLLAAVVTGAWAQEVTLLTTILSADNKNFKSGSQTFDNIATVSFSGEVNNWGDSDGWYSMSERTLTVTAAEGYTITRVKFYNHDGSAFDYEAPFEAILAFGGGDYITKVNGTSIGEGGVTKIEVYGYATTVAVTGVTLSPTSATLTLGETETVTLIPTVLPAEATDKSVTWSSSNEAVATVADGVVTAVAAGTATITVTTTDGAKTATCAVTVAAPAPATYTVTLKEGTEDATSWTIAPPEATTTGVAQGTEVTATYGGTKKVKSVKAVKKAAAAKTLAEATTDDIGKIAGKDGIIYATKADAEAVATGNAVAVIAYVGSETGDDTYKNGLAIALADEAESNWSTAKSTCEGKTAITGAKWCLPSQDQWKQMFKANGGNDASYTGLNTTITTAGGYALPWEMAAYWSSSERNPGVYAYYVFLDEGDADWEHGSEDSGNRHQVRACLAF